MASETAKQAEEQARKGLWNLIFRNVDEAADLDDARERLEGVRAVFGRRTPGVVAGEIEASIIVRALLDGSEAAAAAPAGLATLAFDDAARRWIDEDAIVQPSSESKRIYSKLRKAILLDIRQQRVAL